MNNQNVSPKLYTLSAVAVGFLLLTDEDATRQNALGNWLMLVAQVISTNAYFKQVQQNNNSNNINTNNMNKNNINNMSKEDVYEMIKKVKESLEKELETLKKDIKD